MSLCKQAQAPARGGGLLGRPWLRVPLNGCRKTKPFQSVPWKRQTTVLGTAERESELHLRDRELWFELSYWPEKKDTENMCCWQSRGQTTSDISDGKGNMHFQSVLDYGLSLFHPALMFFIQQYTIVPYHLPYGQRCSSSPVLHLLFLISMDSTPNMHLSSCLKMSPLLLPEAILGLQNHRDGFCIADGIKENQEATFNNWKSLIEKGVIRQMSLC